ncbi:MAG: 16S rRNA (uracil(1498)-N(3))-methyltransferase [Desulfotalea sp.]
MRRFYFNSDNLQNNLVELSTDESNHIRKVLRLECGEEVELLDGQGGVYLAQIHSIDQAVTMQIIKELANNSTNYSVRIAQGMLKGQKMELLVQKSTELGATTFLPFYGERSQGRLGDNQSIKKQHRWQRIAQEACKQCKRTDKMIVAAPASFNDLVQSIDDDSRLRLVFWEEEDSVVLGNFDFHDHSGVDIILGPEGGINREEIDFARQHGWQTVSLGKRILRAETAGIIALGLVQYLAGNMS